MTLIALWVLSAHAGVQQAEPRPESSHDPNAPQRVALLVGLDVYADHDLGSLRFAAADAQGLAAVLRDPARGGFDRVDVLGPQATRRGFDDAFDDVTRHLREQDTFLLYFAGHGTMGVDESQQISLLYLLPSDGRLDEAPETGIALIELERQLKALPAKRRVTIIDACYSDGGRGATSPETREKLARRRGGRVPDLSLDDVGESDIVLYAAHHDQPAIEDELLGHGVYTYYFLEALGPGGDEDNDNSVDVLEAHTLATKRTMEHTNRRQTPWYQIIQVGPPPKIPLTTFGRDRDPDSGLLLPMPRDLQHRGIGFEIDGTPRGPGGVDPGRRRVTVVVDDRPVLTRPYRVVAGQRIRPEQWVKAAFRLDQVLQPTLLLGTGPSWVSRGDVAPDAFWHLDGWWFKRGSNLGRLGVGGSFSRGLGPVGEWGTFPVWTGEARLGWAWGSWLAVGPYVGVGPLWRQPEAGFQIGPMVTPGLHAHLLSPPPLELRGWEDVRNWRLYLSADVGLRLLAIDAEPVWVPVVSATLGVNPISGGR